MKLTKLTVLLATTAMLHGCSTTQCPIEPAAQSPLDGDEMLGLISGYSESMMNITQARWAPELCRLMNSFEISHDRSTSEHGRKLYYLFVSHPQAYFDIARDELDEAPVGMTLIKESHKPRLRTDDDHFDGIVGEEGSHWVPGEQVGLFVMHRLDPQTQGTDDGWVYATTNPDGTEVNEIGMIESCIDCHVAAPRGRLYGAITPLPDASQKFLSMPSNRK